MGKHERKTVDVWEIQGNYAGYGWAVICHKSSEEEAIEQVRCYNENERGVPHRWFHRRIPKRKYEKGEY